MHVAFSTPIVSPLAHTAQITVNPSAHFKQLGTLHEVEAHGLAVAHCTAVTGISKVPCSVVELCQAAGRQPHKLLSLRSTSLRAGRLPYCDGMEPVKVFAEA